MKFHDYDIAKNLKAFDENVFIEELMNSVDTFSEPIQLMINEALKYAVNKTDFFHIYEWLQDPIKRRIPKVSIDTFLDHPHYLGTRTNEGRDIFKMTRIFCRDVIEGGYAEAIELAGIGCERLGTKIIMADGTIKPNTEIKVGDFLMGVDGTPRKVLQIHGGIDDMYALTPFDGSQTRFITKEHRLYLAKGLKRIIKRVDDIKEHFNNYELVYQDGTKTGIWDITYIGKEEYIGIKIDGDELYMWEDFMITHNTGKSFGSQIMACYQAHHLLCLRQPHRNYGLSPDKSLVIMNMGPTASQALDVVFTGIRSFIEASPFFLQFQPNIQATTIRFKEKIDLVSGNSKVTTSIGYNIFSAILDEAAFYLDNDDKNVAKEIYMSLQSRITSRMNGKGGLLVGISSPRYEGDFITEKVAQAEELNHLGKKKYKNIYAIKLQSWKAKDLPPEDLKNPFYFNPRRCIILEDTNLDKLKSEGLRVNRITDPVVQSEDDVWEIPRYLLEKFQNNPEGAKRDYGAIPSTSIAGFFSNPEKISQMFNLERVDPVIAPGRYKFQTRPLRVPYFIHIDIGFNANKKGDYLGFCMGHFGGWELDEMSKEYRMKYYIDLVERIGIIEDTGEVDLSEVRQRIYDLKDMGFFIKLVTFDQFASKDFRQIIEKKGFRTDYVSVDRTTDPYDLVKAAVYEGRIDIYYNETIEKELKGLELIKGNKVDHPHSSSKDLSDALAGVVWNISENTPKSSVTVRNLSENEQSGNSEMSKYKELKAREEYYEKVQRQVAKQQEMYQKIDQMRRNIDIKQQNNSFLF